MCIYRHFDSSTLEVSLLFFFYGLPLLIFNLCELGVKWPAEPVSSSDCIKVHEGEWLYPGVLTRFLQLECLQGWPIQGSD